MNQDTQPPNTPVPIAGSVQTSSTIDPTPSRRPASRRYLPVIILLAVFVNLLTIIPTMIPAFHQYMSLLVQLRDISNLFIVIFFVIVIVKISRESVKIAEDHAKQQPPKL